MTAAILPAAPPPSPPNNGRRYPSPLVKQELARLGKDAESRRAALSALRAVVEEHLEGPGLQSFLQQLADSAEGRHHAAPLLTDLAKVHGARLLPHISLLLHIVGHTLLQSSDSPCLQLACASSLSAIATNACLTHPPERVLPPLALPMVVLRCHKVEALSSGAAACLRALVESEQWRLAPASLVAAVCRKAFCALAARCTQTVAHISLLRSLASINASALAIYGAHLIRLLVHELLPSPCWQLRLAAVQLLESVLQVADYTTLTLQLPSSIDALNKCRHDKMPHIRKAATQALRTAQALASQEEIQQRQQTSSKTKELSAIAGHHQRSRSHESIVHDDDWPLSLTKRLQVIKSPLSSPRNQLSQTLFLSPRSLADFRRDSSPSKLQTPSCDLSPGREPADESDYFCAYFCDSKEKAVSCRRIVHHIHDTPTTPKASPARSDLASARHQIPVPPLPLSDLQEKQQKHKFSPSSAKDVTIHDCTDQLLITRNRSLINIEASRQLTSVNNAEPAQVNENVRSSDGQTPAEKHQAAMQDFQAICGQLLQLREEAENKFLREALQGFSSTSSQDISEGEIIQGQGQQENDGNAKNASAIFPIDQTSSADGSIFLPAKDNLLEIRDEMLGQCDDLIACPNSLNEVQERELDEGGSCNGMHMHEESTSAELRESQDVNQDTGAGASCNGDWSVRDNPIANEEHTGNMSTSLFNKNNNTDNLQGTEDSQGSDANHSGEEALADDLTSRVTKVEIDMDNIKDEHRSSGVLEDGSKASGNELCRSCNEVEIAQPKGCQVQEGEVVSISGREAEAQPALDATGSTTDMAPEEAGLMSSATTDQWQSASAICLDGPHIVDEKITHAEADDDDGDDDDNYYVEAELCEETFDTVGTSVTKKKSSVFCRGFLLHGIAGIVIPITMAALLLHFDLFKQQPQLGITKLSFIPPT